MTLASEASIAAKIERMDARVRRGHPALRRRGIDQTRLAIASAPDGDEAFSFLALGDSGSGRYGPGSPQRQVAELLQAQRDGVGFVQARWKCNE